MSALDTIRPLGLVNYFVAYSPELPPVRAAMYEYWLAGNGLFVRGKREGLEAMVKVTPCQVKGLPNLEPYCRLEYPPLPGAALEMMLDLSRRACDDGQMREALFHVEWVEGYGEWKLHVPDQEASGTSVLPKEGEQGVGTSYARCIIEVHSHHQMKAFFSKTDDEDEQGFRLYGVLGSIFDRPMFMLRVGLYGTFELIKAATVFELPDEVEDAFMRQARRIALLNKEAHGELTSEEAVELFGPNNRTGLWVPGGAREA